MYFKLVVLGLIGLSAGFISACHDGRDNPTPPMPKPGTTQSLDTAQVLTLAQRTSETSAPFVINDGAITLNDTSDTSAPIAVAAM
jgi:hypothetical protein